MSNFQCEHCGAICCDSERGYTTGCEHYPPDIGPQKGPATTARIEAQAKAIRNELANYMPTYLYQRFEEQGRIDQEWLAKGWHFCSELDGALVHREDVKSFCKCFEDEASAG